MRLAIGQSTTDSERVSDPSATRVSDNSLVFCTLGTAIAVSSSPTPIHTLPPPIMPAPIPAPSSAPAPQGSAPTDSKTSIEPSSEFTEALQFEEEQRAEKPPTDVSQIVAHLLQLPTEVPAAQPPPATRPLPADAVASSEVLTGVHDLTQELAQVLSGKAGEKALAAAPPATTVTGGWTDRESLATGVIRVDARIGSAENRIIEATALDHRSFDSPPAPAASVERMLQSLASASVADAEQILEVARQHPTTQPLDPGAVQLSTADAATKPPVVLFDSPSLVHALPETHFASHSAGRSHNPVSISVSQQVADTAVTHSNLMTTPSMARLVIKLAPPGVGEIVLRLQKTKRETTVGILLPESTGLDSFVDEVPELKRVLDAASIRLTHLDILPDRQGQSQAAFFLNQSMKNRNAHAAASDMTSIANTLPRGNSLQVRIDMLA